VVSAGVLRVGRVAAGVVETYMCQRSVWATATSGSHQDLVVVAGRASLAACLFLSAPKQSVVIEAGAVHNWPWPGLALGAHFDRITRFSGWWSVASLSVVAVLKPSSDQFNNMLPVCPDAYITVSGG
jgi:hypothetical protein